MKTIIYHNSRCQKSRCSLELLQAKGTDLEIVEYLKTPPTIAQLEDILKKLGLPAEAIVRKSETIYKELYKDKHLSEKDWIKALVAHPILIERPIIVKGSKAVIGRPPENALTL